MPITAVATQYRPKLARLIARAAIRHPKTLMTAPIMKPLRLPMRAISSDAGIVATADPSTYVVTPSVASAFVSASA